jgi:hypothetical protein
MKYTIIEDCSPYYIRFTHDGIEDITDTCLSSIDDVSFTSQFTHHRFDLDTAGKILNMVPFSKEIEFYQNRVSLFVSQPGLYYRAHKDGVDHRSGVHRFSINYTVKILDDKCVTSWYSDEECKNYPIDASRLAREAIGFKKANHTALKSMVAKPNECILFNTDIFHDFDNTASTNERIVLTLRSTRPGKIYFEDVKKILFANPTRKYSRVRFKSAVVNTINSQRGP